MKVQRYGSGPYKPEGDWAHPGGRFVHYSDYAELQRRLEAAEKERDGLRAFCQEVYAGWPEDLGLDEFDLQDLAEEHGLLKSVEATERCGEVCQCANETDFPTTCFRRTSLLTGKPESDAAIDALLLPDILSACNGHERGERQ